MAANTYIVVSGDTFDEIAQRLGVTPTALQKANPNETTPNKISPGDKLHVPAGSPNTTYSVKQGDTGQSIAKQDDTTFQQLQKLNPEVTWKNLQIGQTVIVPRD